MFWGATVSKDSPVSLKSTIKDQEEQNELLHISNACLDLSAKEGKRVYLQVVREGQTVNVCSLQRSTNEHASIDLYFKGHEEVTFKTEGCSSKVHLSGYWEPSSAGLDQELGLEGFDMGQDGPMDDEEEGSIDDETQEHLDQAQKNAQMNSLPADDDSSSDSVEEEEILKKIQQKREQPKQKPQVVEADSDSEDEPAPAQQDNQLADDDSSDDEQVDLKTLLAQKHKKQNQKQEHQTQKKSKPSEGSEDKSEGKKKKKKRNKKKKNNK